MIIEAVAFLEHPFQFLNRHGTDIGVVRIEVPEKRVEFDVSLDEEMLDVGADDTVMESGLPEGSLIVDSLVVDVFGHGGFE